MMRGGRIAYDTTSDLFLHIPPPHPPNLQLRMYMYSLFLTQPPQLQNILSSSG